MLITSKTMLIILELISSVPHKFKADCNTSQKRSIIKSCLSINEGKIIPTKKFDWLAKVTLTYHLRAGG